MITQDKARELLGGGARDHQGGELGTIEAIYVHDQTHNPEFAAVRVSESAPCLVPLASAKAQDGELQVAYPRDLVTDAPVVGRGDKLSEEDLAKLYFHYGLDYTVTAVEEHTVHVHGGDSDDAVGTVEKGHGVEVKRDSAGSPSSDTNATHLAPPRGSEELEKRTLDELQQLAAERGVAGCFQMTKEELLSVLRSLPRRQTKADTAATGSGRRYDNRTADRTTRDVQQPALISEWLGTSARGSQGEDLGTIEAIYVHCETEEPEFAIVRSAGTGPCLVPLAHAKPQDGLLQLAVARDHVLEAPAVHTGDTLSQEDLAKLYLHYGLRDTITTVESQPRDSHPGGITAERARDTEGVTAERARDAQARGDGNALQGLRKFVTERGAAGWQMAKGTLISPLRDVLGRVTGPGRQSAQSAGAGSDDRTTPEQTGAVASRTSLDEQTVEELRQLASDREIEGRSQMNKDDLVAALSGQQTPTSRRGKEDRRTQEQTAVTSEAGLESRTVEELRQLASEREIEGRSQMSKDDLVAALSGGQTRTSGDGYENWTVAELRKLASKRDIKGRSQMTKDDLVAALSGSQNRTSGGGQEKRAQERTGEATSQTTYEERTVEELRQLAAERNVEGRSQMSKDDLVIALRCYR